jgi:hypothetical protein
VTFDPTPKIRNLYHEGSKSPSKLSGYSGGVIERSDPRLQIYRGLIAQTERKPQPPHTLNQCQPGSQNQVSAAKRARKYFEKTKTVVAGARVAGASEHEVGKIEALIRGSCLPPLSNCFALPFLLPGARDSRSG